MSTRIPLPGVPGSNFEFGKNFGEGRNVSSSILHRLMQEKQAEQQMQQQQANQQRLAEQFQTEQQRLNSHFEQRQASTAVTQKRKQEEFEFNQQKRPGEMRLLEAKIKKESAMAKKAEAGANKDNNDLTPATRTGLQKVVIASKEIIPLLDQLISTDVPDANFGSFSPELKALSDSIKNLSADDLMAVFNLPKDVHSGQMIDQMVSRQKFESIDAYRKRIKWLRGQIVHKSGNANKQLKSGKVEAYEDKQPTANMSLAEVDAELAAGGHE